MNHGAGTAFIVLPLVTRMSDRNRSNQRPVDRLYLLAIIGYALLAAAYLGFFVWRWMG
jgi:hypothetical protein